LVTHYTYDPFGNTTVTGNVNANDVEYTGRENDSTGLYYFRARYYDPSHQRFISEDPLGQYSGINVYRYVHDDPLNRVDPFGLSDITITVTRNTSTPNSTTGTITVNAGSFGSVSGYSLEPPLAGSGPVAIPPGDYTAHWRDNSGPGLNGQAIELDPKNGRNNIQIHPGNTADDTEGCILPGSLLKPDYVGGSRPKTGEINNLVQTVLDADAANGEQTNIYVNIVDNTRGGPTPTHGGPTPTPHGRK
jgi:RHS repeat-associated protein